MFVLVLLKLSDKCKQIIHKPLCFKTHIETAFILGLYVSQVPNFIIVFKSLAGQQWIEQQWRSISEKFENIRDERAFYLTLSITRRL